MGREVGGGIGMGKTCEPKAFSFQCMTKFTTKKKKEYWSGLSFPSPGDLPNPGTELKSPSLQANSLPSEPRRKPFSSDNNSNNAINANSLLIHIPLLVKQPSKMHTSIFL